MGDDIAVAPSSGHSEASQVKWLFWEGALGKFRTLNEMCDLIMLVSPKMAIYQEFGCFFADSSGQYPRFCFFCAAKARKGCNLIRRRNFTMAGLESIASSKGYAKKYRSFLLRLYKLNIYSLTKDVECAVENYFHIYIRMLPHNHQNPRWTLEYSSKNI